MSAILIIDKVNDLINFCKKADPENQYFKAENQMEALRVFDSQKINLVLVDLDIALKAKLNLENSFTPETPIILLSDDGKQLHENYPKVPDHLKFQRPIDLECILATCIAVLENRSETLDHLRNLTKGELLFMEGETPDSLYWLVAGELTVYTNVNGVEKEVGTVHKEEIVGEMAFLGMRSRSATLRAKTSCQLLEIPPEKFLKIVDSQPKWFQSVLKTMSNRLLESNKKG